MSAIDQFIDQQQKAAPDAKLAISTLGNFKPLRIFLIEIAKLSKSDWERLTKHVKILYQVLQAAALNANNNSLADEFVRFPHFAAVIRRIKEGQ
jgi:hypothetical protein